MTDEDLEAYKKLDIINNENNFNIYYKNIEIAVRAKTLGAESDELKQKLAQLKSRIKIFLNNL